MNKFDNINSERYTVVKVETEQPCMICKDKTNYIDYCLEVRVCSKECYEKLTQRIIIGRREGKHNATMNKIKNILGVK